MGILRNLMLLSKRIRRKPLTREDIYGYCAGFIKNPPTIDEWRDVFSTYLVRAGGPEAMSLSEYYRRHFLLPALDSVASAPTWQLQRAACLQAVLADLHWRNLEFCLREAKTDWGSSMILDKLKQIWPDQPPEIQTRLLTACYMMALAAGAALMTLGATYYAIDKQKELEIDLYMQYGRATMMLDVSVMDLIYENHAEDLDAAYSLATWKDERLNPITQQMFNLLTVMKENIVHDTFDVNEFKKASDTLHEEKRVLAAELTRPAQR